MFTVYNFLRNLFVLSADKELKEKQIFESGKIKMIDYLELKKISDEYNNYLDIEKIKAEIIQGNDQEDFLNKVYIFLNSTPSKELKNYILLGKYELLILYEV